jgi:hypothetical protein
MVWEEREGAGARREGLYGCEGRDSSVDGEWVVVVVVAVVVVLLLTAQKGQQEK